MEVENTQSSVFVWLPRGKWSGPLFPKGRDGALKGPFSVRVRSEGAPEGVRCLAQGHFDTPRVGSNRQPADCQTTGLPPEPYRHIKLLGVLGVFEVGSPS